MISNIRAFGNQNLDVRMEDSTIQEFHDMGQVFNEMADRIKYLITEVYEKQLLATKSQVKYLQSQLNPHFQFNILAMLSLKAKMSGNEELYESLNAFSKLMQGKIFRDKEIKIKSFLKDKAEIIKINEEDPDEKMFLDFINRIETKNYDSCVSYVGEVIDSHVATFASEFANVSETVVDVESFFNDAIEMTKQIEKMMF